MNRAFSASLLIAVIVAASIPVISQESGDANPQQKPAQPSAAVTEISADLGTCSVEFKVTDMVGKPLYNAKIKTQLRYGFMSKRKLDLEAGTNSDGRARFINMPNQVKSPILFEGTNGSDTATMTWDPGTNCRAQYPMILGKKAEKEDSTRP